MDRRYQRILSHVVERFADHLGDRLQSAFVKGSIARGDAVWGVSDIDFVLVLDCPDEEDTRLKQQVEREVLEFEGGDALVIQRIAEDRLDQLDEDTRAYWLYACYFDSLVLHGKHPSQLLPPPPAGRELARRMCNILIKGADGYLDLNVLNRQQSREFSKKILNLLALPSLAAGLHKYIAPLDVRGLDLPGDIADKMDEVTAIYRHAPDVEDCTSLKETWRLAKAYVSKELEG